jgi:beta-1,4-mannosyl-glycoprotein beta-1,4-N-acetylglucosaminyltransferase
MDMIKVDVFPFFNELDLLEIRLHELDSFVDFFLITECTVTHSGNVKPLFFAENASRFKKFRSKIIHQVVDDVPEGIKGFEIDWFQRDAAKPLLNDMLDKDSILIYGDVDEIPNVNALTWAMQQLSPKNSIGCLAQDLFYYYVNLQEVSGKLLSNIGEFPGVRNPKWLGTTISQWSFSSSMKLSEMRGPMIKDNGFRVENGGWHFSYVGGSKDSDAFARAKVKLEATAHQELNTPLNRLLLRARVGAGRDMYRRRHAKFVQTETSYLLPDYLQANASRFEYLFLPND